jgi:glyoxylase-like metal-dependent hydrolase (beta-lactamase superfamily II)
MKIGNYQLHTIETGKMLLDGGAMFGVVPKIIWEKTNPADEKNRIDIALRTLLIIGEGKKILVDCGIGEKFSEKHQAMYGIDHSMFKLESSLNKYGISTGDITDLILTHLHFDHAGGATYLDKTSNQVKMVFPNARHYIQKTNLEHALEPNEKDRASYLKQDFEILQKSNKLVIISGEQELFPGIHLLISNGHTIGQQLIKITDGNNTLLYCGDLIPTSSHIPVPFVMSYDLQPLLSMQEKKEILYTAAIENWTLFYEHDPYMEASTVKQTEKGFALKEKVSL